MSLFGKQHTSFVANLTGERLRQLDEVNCNYSHQEERILLTDPSPDQRNKTFLPPLNHKPKEGVVWNLHPDLKYPDPPRQGRNYSKKEDECQPLEETTNTARMPIQTPAERLEAMKREQKIKQAAQNILRT